MNLKLEGKPRQILLSDLQDKIQKLPRRGFFVDDYHSRADWLKIIPPPNLDLADLMWVRDVLGVQDKHVRLVVFPGGAEIHVDLVWM